MANGSVSHMILRLEQQRVGIRPPPYHRLLTTKLSRSISQPATRLRVSAGLPRAVSVADGDSNNAGEPASRLPEKEIGRKSGANRATRQTSDGGRLAHARTDLDDDVRISSSLRRRGGTFTEVCCVFGLHGEAINTGAGEKKFSRNKIYSPSSFTVFTHFCLFRG